MEQAGATGAEVMGADGAFVGQYTHALDPKRRLTIPSEWRDLLKDANRLYVLPDVHERCLRVVPANELMHRIRKMRNHPISDRQARQFARALGSRSGFVTWDAQGRIRVKDELLESVGIGAQAVLVGTFDSFELWSPDNLTSAEGMDDRTLNEAAQHVGF